MSDAYIIEISPKKQTHSFTQTRSQNTLMYAMLVDGLSYGVICIANCGTFYSSSFFNELMTVADGEHLLMVLFVGKAERVYCRMKV